MSRVAIPCEASSAPRLIAVVVLPTPPFWFATARITGIGSVLSRSQTRSRPHSGALPICQIAHLPILRRRLFVVYEPWFDACGGASLHSSPLPRRRDRDLARLAFTDANGHHGRVLRQRHVDDATLVRRHRLQGNAAAGTSYTRGRTLGQANQGLFAAATVAIDVDGEGNAAISLLTNNQVNDILNRGQSLSPAANEDAQVVAFDVQDSFSEANAIAGRLRGARRDLGLDGHE